MREVGGIALQLSNIWMPLDSSRVHVQEQFAINLGLDSTPRSVGVAWDMLCRPQLMKSSEM
jgi:hypothetical protein